jgi:cyclopropane-fatty-acyl-phospholipid synthase
MRRKLDYGLAAIGIAPGQRLLDIGAGWGSMVEYAGRRGIDVTSLTISRASERFVSELIAREGLPCRVVHQHLFDYRPAEKFDAIVNMGVTEHLPDYRTTLACYQRLLKPGGRVYLDACSSRIKYPFSSFSYRYLFPGNPSPLVLHDFLTEAAKTPFEVVAVHNDRRSYELTLRHWAQNLERSREEIVRRWGKGWFRRFQLYFWSSVDCMVHDVLGAYRVVLELPAGTRA